MDEEVQVTGFNHYPNCSCGWCINTARNNCSIDQLRSSMRVQDARRLLKANFANSISGCFVNPNARCPVCFSPVFDYANKSGSRVYFDDLGPPWPKHPCTDNPRQPIIKHVESAEPPKRRAAGIVKELIAAASIVGAYDYETPDFRTSKAWELLFVFAVERRGNKNLVKGEFVASKTNEVTEFHCFSSEPLFEVGDFVSTKGNQISFLYQKTLTPITFLAGSTIQFVQQIDTPVAAPPPSRLPLIKRKPVEVIRSKKDEGASNHQMTKAEMVHYHSNSVHVADLCDQLEPIVKTYARSGTRKPRDVSNRLNADGFTTACGARWTPRLTHFLLALIFSDSTPQSSTKSRLDLPPKSTASKLTKRIELETDPLTHEELVRRLSKLGRVISEKGQ